MEIERSLLVFNDEKQSWFVTEVDLYTRIQDSADTNVNKSLSRAARYELRGKTFTGLSPVDLVCYIAHLFSEDLGTEEIKWSSLCDLHAVLERVPLSESEIQEVYTEYGALSEWDDVKGYLQGAEKGGRRWRTA